MNFRRDHKLEIFSNKSSCRNENILMEKSLSCKGCRENEINYFKTYKFLQ